MNIFSLWGSIKMRDDEYRKSLNKAEQKTKRTGDAMERDWNETMRNMERRMAKLGDNMQRIGGRMSLAITAPLTIVSGVILKVAGDFEASMNRVSAVSGATGEDLESLRDLAKELGSTTAFSASQAADAMNFLAMAGFSVEEVAAALPGTLELAAAGQLDLAEAADIASNVLTGFGLEASEISRVNDTLAATSTKANTDIRQLGEALSFAAPVAAAFDVSIEDSAAAVGLLSNAGIQASRAGTGLSRILTILSSEASELGINMRDAQGNMLPLADILEQIEERGLSADEAMEIFGQRGGPAMQALLSQGSDALRELTGELENAGGTAARIAAKQMEGFNGAMLEFRSALEAAGIAIAESGLLEWATNMARGAANMLRGFANLNPVVLRFVTVLGMVLAATGPVLVAVGTFLKMVPFLQAALIAIRSALVLVTPTLTVIALAVAALYIAWQNNFLGIQDITKRVVDWVGEKIKTLMIVGQAVLDSWETIAWGFGEIVRNMGDAAGGAGEVILGAFQVAGAAVEGSFITMAKGVRRVFADMLNGIIRGINSFTSAASGALGGLGIEIGQIPEVAVESWSEIADETTRRVDEASQKVEEGQARIGSALRANGYVAAGVRSVVERNLWAQASTAVETAEATEESVESVAEAFEEAFAQDIPNAVGETVAAVEDLEEQIATTAEALVNLTARRQRQQTEAGRRSSAEVTDPITQMHDRLGELREAARRAAEAEENLRRRREEVIMVTRRLSEDELDWRTRAADKQGEQREAARLLAEAEENLVQRREDLLAVLGELRPVQQDELDWRTQARDLQAEQAITAAAEAQAEGDLLARRQEMLTAMRVAMPLQQDELDWRTQAQDLMAEQERAARAEADAEEALLARRLEVIEATERAIETELDWMTSRRDRDFGPRGEREGFGTLDPSGMAPRREEAGGEFQEGAPPPAKPKGPTFLEKAKKGLSAFGDAALGLAEKHVPMVGSALQGFAAGPVAGAVSIFSELLGNSEAWAEVQAIFTEILKEAATALEPLISAVLKLLDALWPIIEVAIQLLEVALQPLTFMIKNVLAPVIGFVARLIAGLYNAIARAINWALGWLGVNLQTIDVEGDAPRPEKDPIGDPTGDDENPGEDTGGQAGGSGEQSFGRVSQGVQLAVATPLVEAAVSMKASADIIASTLGAGGSLTSQISEIGNFSDVLGRLTPVLERLLDEGVDLSISSPGAVGPRAGDTMGSLRPRGA